MWKNQIGSNDYLEAQTRSHTNRIGNGKWNTFGCDYMWIHLISEREQTHSNDHLDNSFAEYSFSSFFHTVNYLRILFETNNYMKTTMNFSVQNFELWISEYSLSFAWFSIDSNLFWENSDSLNENQWNLIAVWLCSLFFNGKLSREFGWLTHSGRG